jgi:hypothetical protein
MIVAFDVQHQGKPDKMRDPAAAISALARVSDQVEVETDPADHEVADG